ncbi:MAG TPA: phosphonate ABC transporter ATP-binding protein [Planctomycetes bacterium]|nr:phosphonate ABC transporter ATP-binding protein [Planctomycetota bacterium]
MSITVRRLSKRFRSNGRACCALDQIDLDIADGEMVALIGPSGSGKSTLMRHIAGLVAGDPGEGDVLFDGRPVQSGGRISREIRELRCRIGFIFQQFNLVGRLDVLTNVLAGAIHRHPMWRTLAGVYPMQERLAAMHCLERVGMDDKAAQRASTLSGGQQQRVAIARAMLQGARTILADEPIASLDPSSARRVMETLARINSEDRTTVVVSLHQVEYARSFCSRAIALRAGKVVFDGPATDLTDDRLLAIYHHRLDGEDGPSSSPSGPAAPVVAAAPEPEPAFA